MANLLQALRAPVVLAVIACLVLGATPFVHADSLQQQIDNLNATNAQASSQLNGLAAQASSYQAAISELQSQISSVQGDINANEAQQVSIQQQIQSDQAKIAQQKQLLSQDIESMYVNGSMSTIEMLATSSNLSSFVDAETYRNAVQLKLQGLLTQIAQLEDELETQKTQLQQTLQTQQAQQATLSNDESQQNSLLSMNQAQQATYTQQIQTANSEINQLQQEEMAANESGSEASISGGACGGSATLDGVTYTDTYPASLCDIPQDSATDPWGLLNRECVSYAAWMEYSTGHYVPYGLGNATNWPSNVPSSWVSSTPQVGDIAIRPGVPGLTVDGESDVGHAMYVEAVINSTTIVVSEYNENFNGDWSIQQRSTNALYNGYQDNLVFIHFPNS